ncbi:MAG: family 16 glycosylhydrolase [Bacteroidia bacterium]
MKHTPTTILTLLAFAIFSPLLQAQDCSKLIWADEFNGTSLDLSKWNYDIGNGCPELCGWGNNEQQYYTDSPDNISVNNGLLTITAKTDTIGGMQYSSAKITTKAKGDFRYGRFEASMRLPETQGLWPAFWMLPTDQKYGEWPKSGEIDIMELLGQNPDQVLGTIHTGLPWTFKSASYFLPPTESFADTFHVFALEWDPDTIRWFVDGNEYHVMPSDSIGPWAPFQEDFHLIFNVAVGGNLPGPTDSTTVLPQLMEIDYVRVYNRPSRLQILGEQPVIGATGMTYQTFDISGADYIWSVPTGASIASGQGTNTISVDWGCTAGDIMLELQTDCDTAMLTYAVPSFSSFQIDGLQTVEESQSTLTYQVSSIDGGSYNWTVPSDATILSGQGTNMITLDWGCSDGEVIVAANGSCASPLADTIQVMLKTYSVKGFASVSENSTARVYRIDPISGATYTWSVPTGAIITAGQGTPSITVDFGTQGGLLKVLVGTSCGSQAYGITITIDPSSLYCDFDGTDLLWDVFGGAFIDTVPNPFSGGINTSANVGRTRKDPGAQSWGGIYADLAGEMDLDANPLLQMKVYSAKTGSVNFKLEDQSTGRPPVEFEVDLDTINQWVNLVWDFSDFPADTFDRIALFFDFGETDTSYWYFDDVFGRPDPTASLENIDASLIKVFPNPSNGLFQIHLNGQFANVKTFEIQILDVKGRIVHSQQSQGKQPVYSVDLKSVPDGFYFLRLLGPETQYVKMIEKVE